MEAQRDRMLLWGIGAAVVALHLFVVLFLALQPSATTLHPNKTRKVVVKTIALQPEKKAAHALPAPAASTVNPSAPSPLAPAKEIKKTEKKQTVKSPPPVKKKEASSPSKSEKISKMEESLNKVHVRPVESTPASTVVASPTALAIDSLPAQLGLLAAEVEVHYRDELSRRLKAALSLPERGEVTLELTLNRSGVVVKVVITGASSPANRKYVEKAVPPLVFSGFGGSFGGEAQHTFTIVLSGMPP